MFKIIDIAGFLGFGAGRGEATDGEDVSAKTLAGRAKRARGAAAEAAAVRYLERAGLRVLERNYHSRFGEIDIIAEDAHTLHFIEVKASSQYDALERITREKMKKIIKTIDFYMMRRGGDKEYQIDAIVVLGDDIEWIKNINID